MLRQAGTFVLTNPVDGRTCTRTFPPCMYGQECVGFRRDPRFACCSPSDDNAQCVIKGLPHNTRIVFTMHQSPEEWKTFMQTDRAPTGHRPCILCGRNRMSKLLYYMRAARESAGSTLEFEKPRQVAQLWTNPVECEDGYYRNYTHGIRPDDMLVAPIVEFAYNMLSAYQHPHCQGQWWVDQTALKWTDKPLPTNTWVGMMLSTFSNGASGCPIPPATYAPLK